MEKHAWLFVTFFVLTLILLLKLKKLKKEKKKRTEIKIAYNQRNLDIKYSTNFNKTIINVKKAKMGICPFCPKDVAKCFYSETI